MCNSLIASKSHSINNPIVRRRKLSPPNSSNAHLGSKLTKVKAGRFHEAQRQPSWGQLHQQQRPSADNWSGSYCQSHPLSSHDRGSEAGRREVHGAADGEDEEDFGELFSRLYQSSQPSELDQVYFDMKDVLTDSVDEQVGTGRNILVEEENEEGSKEMLDSTSTCSDASAAESRSQSTILEQNRLSAAGTTSSSSLSSSVFSQRYLTLSSHPHAIPMVHRPRLIICGAEGMGQSSLLSPALLHALEEFPVKTLDLTTVFAMSTKSPEEACTQVGDILCTFNLLS